MPYFNSLRLAKYGLATQYYSEQHNSLSALMWLVAGQPVTGNDATTTCYNLNNIARQLIARGLTWALISGRPAVCGVRRNQSPELCPAGIIQLLTSRTPARPARKSIPFLSPNWQPTSRIMPRRITHISVPTWQTTRTTGHWQQRIPGCHSIVPAILALPESPARHERHGDSIRSLG